jgi:hypothetical protein
MQQKLLLLFLLIVVSFPTRAQTAEEVIEKHIQFIGGKSEWRKIKTLITSGDYDYGGIVFPFTTYSKTPNCYKFIVPFNGKYFAQGYDGKNGWKIDAFKNETKPTILQGKEATQLLNEADVEIESPFIDYLKKGHSAVVEGNEIVDDQKCFKIKFTRRTGDTEYYWFDEKSFSMIKKKAIAKNPELGGSEIETSYSDYRNIEGIKIPFKSVTESNGQMILTVMIKNVKANSTLKEKDFKVENALPK